MTPDIVRPGSVLDDMDALVPPAFWHCPEYVETIGPEVCGLVESFGRTPNPEQRLLLEGSFGMDRAGRLTAFEVFVLASRQNLKTGFLTFRALGKALLLRRPLQLWTAHKESATDQAFIDIKEMIAASDELSRRVKAYREGKGDKELVFVNGCRIVFRPRTGKAGQSMSTDDVDMDEYFAVEAKHLGSLVPTLSTRPKAQIGEASSAPHPGSVEQRAVMARGRAAALGLVAEPRLLYGEWSPMRRVGSLMDGRPRFGPPSCGTPSCTHAVGSAAGCIADDREVIKLANPSVGRSRAPAISWEYVSDERRKLAGEALPEYFRERLSIGSEDSDVGAVTIFGPPSVWLAGTVGRVPVEPTALGLAMSADRAWVGLTGAAWLDGDEDDEDPDAWETAVPVDRMLVGPILHTSDVGAAMAELARIQAKTDCVVVYDEKGPAAQLVDDLDQADVVAEPVPLADYARSSSRVYDQVTAGGPPRFLHLHNRELNEQVAAASWRWVGDVRILGRREGDDAVDVTLFEAAILAAGAAERFGGVNLG